jgi:hypothetical protein
LAFIRSFENQHILVLVNLSATAVNFDVKDKLISGMARNVFTATEENLPANGQFSLDAWGYRVYELNH